MAVTAIAMLSAKLIKLPFQIEEFGTSVMEAARKLRIYNGAINATLARQEYQQRQLAAKTAQEVAPSTAMLGESLMRLRRDLQPIQSQIIRATNYLATIAVTLTDKVLPILIMLNGVMNILQILALIEKNTRKEQGKLTIPLLEHLQKIAQNDWGQPKNKKPGGKPPKQGPGEGQFDQNQ